MEVCMRKVVSVRMLQEGCQCTYITGSVGLDEDICPILAGERTLTCGIDGCQVRVALRSHHQITNRLFLYVHTEGER